MSSTVSIIAIIVDTEIATCNIIKIIMRLEENHTFLVIETPRSALFFNYVTSSFACPTQNKKISPRHWKIQWIQVRSYSHASPRSHMKSTIFSPKLERDLWRMVVKFKFNKSTSIKCNRNLTLLKKFRQEGNNFDHQRTLNQYGKPQGNIKFSSF